MAPQGVSDQSTGKLKDTREFFIGEPSTETATQTGPIPVIYYEAAGSGITGKSCVGVQSEPPAPAPKHSNGGLFPSAVRARDGADRPHP